MRGGASDLENIGRERETSVAFCPGRRLHPGQKAPFCPGWWLHLGQKVHGLFCLGWSHHPRQKASFLSRLVSTTGIKDLYLPAGPASRWTRDKSHLLSRVQRQPGQMAWNKGLFCSSVAEYLKNYSKLYKNKLQN